MRKITVLFVSLGLVAGLAACNTVKGVGEDIKSVGRAGERAID